MITVSGTLAIRTIHGSRGTFNVGRLITEIGEFAVKDSLIEEYDEGRYKGEFGIISITPSTYFAGGRTVVEVRARLGTIALDEVAALAREDRAPMREPDPIDTDSPVTAAPSAVAPVAAKPSPVEGAGPAGDSGGAVASTDDTLAALFGTLWPLGDRVKLDPTVDRGAFRLQRDQLKALGYRFEPVGQYWERG